MERATCKSVIVRAGRKLSLSAYQIGELLSEFDKAWQQGGEDVVAAHQNGVNVENGGKSGETAGDEHMPLWCCEAERRAFLYAEG